MSPVYRIKGPWSGTLSISARPRGGDWLEDEIRSWHEAGFDVIVSLLTPQEAEEMDLKLEEQYSRQQRVKFVSFPIEDRGVPQSRASTLKLLENLESDLANGKSINIHCRQGIGRSALIAASVLIAKGVSTDDAIQRISAARNVTVPETLEQRKWIDSMASISLVPTSKPR